MSSSAVSLPSRRWSRVVAAVLLGASLIVGGVVAGRASVPAPPVAEIDYGKWRSGYAFARMGERAAYVDIAMRPAGGYAILDANDGVSVVLVDADRAPRTIRLSEVALPRDGVCSCWMGGCTEFGPVLLHDDGALVVMGMHARRAGVVHAEISTDGGETWSGRDLAENVTGHMSYSFQDGVLAWYAEEAEEDGSKPTRRRGEIRMTVPRGPEVARHAPR